MKILNRHMVAMCVVWTLECRTTRVHIMQCEYVHYLLINESFTYKSSAYNFRTVARYRYWLQCCVYCDVHRAAIYSEDNNELLMNTERFNVV